MVTVQAQDWPDFLRLFGIFHHAGVEVMSLGGNQLAVPDDTDPALLRAAGVQVDEPAEPEPPPPAKPRRRTAKPTTQPEG